MRSSLCACRYFVQIGPLLIAARDSPLLVIFELMSFRAMEGTSTCLYPASALTRLLLGFAPQAIALAILILIEVTCRLARAARRSSRSQQANDAPPAPLDKSASRIGSKSVKQIAASGGPDRPASLNLMSVATFGATALAIYMFTVNSIALTVFSYLDCRSVYVDGVMQHRVHTYPYIRCDSADYIRYKGLVVTILVLELVVIPVLILIGLVYAKIHWKILHSGSQHLFARVFVVIYGAFRPSMFFWDIFTLARRVTLVTIAIFLSTNHVQRLVTSTLLCTVFLMVQVLFQPFNTPAENVTESIALGLLCLLGFMLAVAEYPLSSAESLGFGLLILLPALMLIIWVAVSNAERIKAAAITARSKIAMAIAWLRTHMCGKDAAHAAPDRSAPVDMLVELAERPSDPGSAMKPARASASDDSLGQGQSVNSADSVAALFAAQGTASLEGSGYVSVLPHLYLETPSARDM